MVLHVTRKCESVILFHSGSSPRPLRLALAEHGDGCRKAPQVLPAEGLFSFLAETCAPPWGTGGGKSPPD